MSAPQDEDGARSRLPFGRRRLKIEGHQEGDVWAEKPVTVTGDASIAGNIFAPRLTVAGSVYGSVVARELVVQAGGSVWGDVHAIVLRVEAGGHIAGMLGELDEERYQQVMVQGSLPPSFSEKDAGSGERSEVGDQPSHGREELDELRRLRSELSAALAAQAELRDKFDQKVAARVGETMIKSTELEKELTQSQADSATLNLQIDRLRQEGKSRDQLIAQLRATSAAADARLEAESERFQALQSEAEALKGKIEELQSAAEESEARVAASRQEMEALMERISSLEAALQASVLHGSEQEQSLLRWQQLADDTEAQAKMLQEEVASLRAQMDATEAELDGARLRQLELEKESEVREEALREKDAALDRQAERFRLADGALKDALAEIEELRRAHGTGALGSARELVRVRERITSLKEELVASQEVSSRLADALAKADLVAEKRNEQLLWYKVNLETSSQELDRAREQSEQVETHVAQLNSSLEEAQIRESQLTAELVQLRSASEKEASGYETMLNSKESQLKASEQEIQHLLQELEEQGQRLAAAQASLVERELQLGELRSESDEARQLLQAKLIEQSNFITRMKQVTSARISELEARLSESLAKPEGR